MPPDKNPEQRDPFRVSPEGYAAWIGVVWMALLLRLLTLAEIAPGEFLRRLLLITVGLVALLAFVIVIDAICHREKLRWPFVRARKDQS